MELFGPFFGLEAGRRVARNEEEGAHGVHVAERRLRLGHLERRDAQTPQIAAVVVGGLRVVLAGDHLGRHPVRRPDERVAPPDRPVQLRRHAEIDCHRHTRTKQKHVSINKDPLGKAAAQSNTAITKTR